MGLCEIEQCERYDQESAISQWEAMTAFIPAPAFCQHADEELLVKIGSVISPNFVVRLLDLQGLYLQMEGDYRDARLQDIAAPRFQVLVGVLRAWLPGAGQRTDEIKPGLGTASVRDEAGNQVVLMRSVVDYSAKKTDVQQFAVECRNALAKSELLRNALWLNGRRDRNAADFYMIYEYAEKDFGSSKQITSLLGVSANDLERLRKSTNNLAPLDGGRHATGTGEVDWSLAQQQDFIARFLKSWIRYRSLEPQCT